MKILLVAPCAPGEQRHVTMDIPQLTLSLIAALTPAHHEVIICEEVYGDKVNYDEDYDVIGITLMTQTSLRGYEVANEFKKRGKKVVFGGIHASALPHEAIQYGDAVVIGEAEGGLWKKVLKDIEKNTLQKFYKLDTLPDMQQHTFARRDLIKCSSGKFAVAPVETTRGCPYNCDFCTVSRFFGLKQRHKPIKDIIKDIESCNEKYLFFQDDNITGDKRFARKLFEEMIPLKKQWAGQASINLTKDPELMKLAKKSGCMGLLIGFESMTEGGINHYRKTLKTVDDNILAVKKLRDNGIFTMASLVFGLDADTPDVFEVSHKFLTKSKVAFFQSCVLTPYPGTPVFNSLKEQGRILTDDWSKYDATKVLIQPKSMTPEQLLKGYNELKWEIYSNNSIVKRMVPHLKGGFLKSAFYVGLNKGYQKRHNPKIHSQVHRNPDNMPVDFDTHKRVMPVKQKETVVI